MSVSMIRTLTLREAAKLLKCHPETIRQKLKSGEIPAAKVGRRWVIMESDIENYLRGLHNSQRRVVQTSRSKEKAPCLYTNVMAIGTSASTQEVANELDMLLAPKIAV
ncbi:MAG: DNA-binding protein [Proteobacteria bacterium]|nr:MAG: DNA-binding protein [Pseudomonadota bacterium]